MRKIDQVLFRPVGKQPGRDDAVQDRKPRQLHARKREYGNGDEDDRHLPEQREEKAPDRRGGAGVPPLIAQHDEILDGDVDQDQRPGDVVLHLKALPVHARALADVIEQIHVDEHEDVIAHTVLAVHICVERGKAPDLYDRKPAQHIGEKHRGADKAVFDVVQERVVPPDDVYEDQVIDQLQIFNFLFFLEHEVPVPFRRKEGACL